MQWVLQAVALSFFLTVVYPSLALGKEGNSKLGVALETNGSVANAWVTVSLQGQHGGTQGLGLKCWVLSSSTATPPRPCYSRAGTSTNLQNSTKTESQGRR